LNITCPYTTHHYFKFYQIGVKSAFLNGLVKEDVCVEQPLGFKSEEYPNHFINSIRHSMGLSKHQEHGMNALEIFYLTIVLGLERVILLTKIYL
jgi:hypothetical protein